jgi:hypothetical protein
MILEEIQEELINSFDFEKALLILERLDEDYDKNDLIQIANGLIKMLYQSREMDDVFFSSGHLLASRAYIDGVEVEYNLSFTFEIHSEFTYALEKPFFNKTNDKNSMLKDELNALLELNQNEYEMNEENELAQANILKLEKILMRLE